jgi:signal peptidase I
MKAQLLFLFISIFITDSMANDKAFSLFYNKEYTKAEQQFLKEINSNEINKGLGYYYLGLIKYLDNNPKEAVAYWSTGKIIDSTLFKNKIFRMPTSSMEPTLEVGDYIFVDVGYYKYNKPQKADLALFISPQDNKTKYIRRIVGIEGDSVKIVGSKLYVNNEIFKFPFTKEVKYSPTVQYFPAVYINRDSIFVIGDNVCNSFDSRDFGSIGKAALVGKALAIYHSETQSNGEILQNASRSGIILK